ncbi:MAG: cytochrome d ubiquinol oxidase subunit II [Solirubrobacteraceae bacterium]
MLQALPLVFVLAGLALYTVLAGADLGAGFWQLTSARSKDGGKVRDYAHRAMGPVWETNHVWLIFVLTVFWTAYPQAFGSLASTLAVPLFIALIGIVFRGAAYALREGAATPQEAGRIDGIFAFSAILVPFALGAAVGGIATNRVPVGNAAGHLWSSWLNGPSIVIGVLAVATSAYLAGVFLAADSAHDRERALEQSFRARALCSGTVTGAIAVGAIFVLKHDNHDLFQSLVSGRALAGVLVSAVAGLATLLLVYLRRYEPARYSAALAVAAIVAGWALSRWPLVLPNLSVDQAAAGHDTLVAVVVVVLAGAAILLPALALLFNLTLTGRLRSGEGGPAAGAATHPSLRVGLLIRVAAACLIAGTGLLGIADAGWAHGIGVACLILFAVIAFGAIAASALDAEAAAASRLPVTISGLESLGGQCGDPPVQTG